MQEKRIMTCLDGSKYSISALRTAILFARESEATIVGVYVDTSHGAITALSTPKIKEEKWTKEAKEIIKIAKEKSERRRIKFEGIVIAGYNAGNDLANFANNKKIRLIRLLWGQEGQVFQESFFGSTSNFVLHKAKIPVTIVK